MTQYDVTDVCQEIRKCFERMLAISGGNLPHGKGIADVIAVAVTCEEHTTPPQYCNYQMFDTPVEDNHIHNLVKCIVRCYCKVRLYHLGKEATPDACGNIIRKKLNKLVLFNHQ